MEEEKKHCIIVSIVVIVTQLQANTEVDAKSLRANPRTNRGKGHAVPPCAAAETCPLCTPCVPGMAANTLTRLLCCAPGPWNL
jgi:hypothetical protein